MYRETTRTGLELIYAGEPPALRVGAGDGARSSRPRGADENIRR
jgi:hypothetical protein